MAYLADLANFMAPILDRPQDDLARLIFADYLDERHEHDRAEFVRVQCELAARATGNRVSCSEFDKLRERERTLLSTNCLDWIYSFGDGPVVANVLETGPIVQVNHGDAWKNTIQVFHRGFLTQIYCDRETWRDIAQALLVTNPIEVFRITDVPTEIAIYNRFRLTESQSALWCVAIRIGEPKSGPNIFDPRIENPTNVRSFCTRSALVQSLKRLTLAQLRQTRPVRSRPQGMHRKRIEIPSDTRYRP